MEESQVTEVSGEAKKDIYSRHVEGFVKAAEEDFDKALDRFGFTVWHSLPPKDAAVLKERLGIRPLEALDFYNRGTAYAMEAKWAEAEADLRQAVKADPESAQAVHNLAVCLENLGRLGEARETYRAYLKMLDRARGRRDFRFGTEAEIALETARIHQHLETLEAS